MPTFNANVLPSSTGFDLGSASQRWDAFLQQLNVSGQSTQGGDIIPTATGLNLGSSSARWDAFLEVVFAGVLNGVRIVDGNKFAQTGAGIQAAIDDALSGGGGYVFIPAGTYTITDLGSSVGLSLKNNVYLVGAGQGRTILQLGASENSHVIQASGISNTGVFNLTVDGNRDNNAGNGVHGIRSGGVTTFHIDNVEVKETRGYGIGLETGDQIGIYLRNLYINNVGRDGIDFKNPNGLNDVIFLSNIRVEDFGLDGALTGQAGIDVRGPAGISGVFVKGFSTDGRGVKFNNTSGGAFGGRRGSLSNFHLETTTIGTTVGVEVRDDYVAVSNGYMRNLSEGWFVTQNGQGDSIANVTCEDCTVGFRVNDGDFAALTNVTASGGTTAFRFGTATKNTITNGRAIGGVTEGVRVDGSSDSTTIIGGDYTGSTTPLIGSGTNVYPFGAEDITPSKIRQDLELAKSLNPLEGTLSNVPRWIFKQVDFGDMTAAATADTFTLWTLPANTMIHDVVGKVVTAWSGGSISAAVASVGTQAGSANDLTLDDNFFTGGTRYELHDATANGGKGTLLFDATDKFAPYMFVVGGVVELQMDLTGDDHVNATAGIARIYILVSQPLANITTEAS